MDYEQEVRNTNIGGSDGWPIGRGLKAIAWAILALASAKKEAEREPSQLRNLCFDLLDDINRRYGDKDRTKWECPILQKINDLIGYK